MLLSFSTPSFVEISAKLHMAQPENESRVPVLSIYSSSGCQYEVRKKHFVANLCPCIILV